MQDNFTKAYSSNPNDDLKGIQAFYSKQKGPCGPVAFIACVLVLAASFYTLSLHL